MGRMKAEFGEWADRIADADPHQGGRELRERMAEASAAGLSAEDIEHVSGWPAAVVRAIVADVEAGKVHAVNTYAWTSGIEAACACGWSQSYSWDQVRGDRRPGVVTREDHDKARDLAAVDHPAGDPSRDPGKVESETVTEWSVFRSQAEGGAVLLASGTAAEAAQVASEHEGARKFRRTVTRSPWVEEG